MDFLEKLNFLMRQQGLNKNSLANQSNIPYTTIDGLYKKGYANVKLSTLKKLAAFFDTTLDYLIRDDITDSNYGKTEGFPVKYEEIQHIKKYRTLDEHGKRLVSLVLNLEADRCHKEPPAWNDSQLVFFPVLEYLQPASAGSGEWNDSQLAEDLLLVKSPPKGTSYVVRVHGNSMEPTYLDGDRLFVRAQEEIDEGEIGIFVLNGDVYVKELRENVLFSHNRAYAPIPLSDSVKCQGKVLGVCTEDYWKRPSTTAHSERPAEEDLEECE